MHEPLGTCLFPVADKLWNLYAWGIPCEFASPSLSCRGNTFLLFSGLKAFSMLSCRLNSNSHAVIDRWVNPFRSHSAGGSVGWNNNAPFEGLDETKAGCLWQTAAGALCTHLGEGDSKNTATQLWDWEKDFFRPWGVASKDVFHSHLVWLPVRWALFQPAHQTLAGSRFSVVRWATCLLHASCVLFLLSVNIGHLSFPFSLSSRTLSAP